MITIETLIEHLSGPNRQDIEEWISNDWVRPDGRTGHYEFQQIDVARVRLIHQLRIDMQVNNDALPLVLSLLDQLYDQRRRMRELSEALSLNTPPEIIKIITQHLLNKRNNQNNISN